MQTLSGPVLRNQVCDTLRAQIIEGRLPPASILREERLAAELDVSRTPLREAIRQLAEEGFLEQSPRRGARVASLSAGMAKEVYEVREALEGMAARLAAQNISESALGLLGARLERLRPEIAAGNYADTGDFVHGEIFRACGNARLQRLMEVYSGKVEWIQRTAFAVSGRLDLAYREHESIFRALQARDGEWAEFAVRSHIRNTLAELLELASNGKSGWQPTPTPLD